MTNPGEELITDVYLEEETAPVPPEYSDDANAEKFSEKYADELRYVSRWGWMSYTGQRWQNEEDPLVFQRARTTNRSISHEADVKDDIKRRLASAQAAASVERLARGDHRHFATTEQWDSNLLLLNTPTGTVDLGTGKLRPHHRNDYQSKITAAGPGGDCPLWKKFLHRITGENTDVQDFLQRTIGYCLTASTTEQCLFFLYGTGKNGKSVFLNTVSNLFGDYAKTAPMSAFTATNSEQHPTDLAGLHGARLVTAIETEDGKQWAEAKIKALTGGDSISCRYMRQDFWQYVPKFKILIAGNHKPTIRTVDEAIRRRIHLIPFTVWIPEEERDKDLEVKLRAEFPGILQWAIEGCLEWQNVGLNPPTIVQDATREYLEAEDVIGRWIDDRCVCGRQYESVSSALFKNYKDWAEAMGERPRAQRILTRTLEERGFKKSHGRSGTLITGIALKEDTGGY
jgi:putative DNA primase/helicase